jgi:Ala-tRNA(Pro) deacylase
MLKAELLQALEEAGVAYERIHHDRTETAADEAKAPGVSPDEVAKTLVLDGPAGHVRAVVPASGRLDLHKLRDVLGVPGKRLHLATEEELERDYPQFELGAVPPFGGPQDPVVIDRSLAGRETVVLEAGSHEDSIRVATSDLLKLTHPTVADICAE